VDDLHTRNGRVLADRREPIPFMIDEGMDEALMPGREDVAAA
jgi:hypothetical protein